jgi:hypothetical protein
MLAVILRFAMLIISALLAGAMVAIGMVFNSSESLFPKYLVQHQNLVKTFNVFMPLLGLAAIILTLSSAFNERANRTITVSLVIAAVLFIASGLITRFGNQPINAIVMTWTPDIVPNNWNALREKWMTLHVVRTVSSLLAFCIIAWSIVRK